MIGFGLLIAALALLALMLMSNMANVGHRGIPGPQDAALEVQAAVTKTANFDGAGLDLGKGFEPGGIGKLVAAVVDVTALDLTSGNETYALTLQESADNVTFAACGLATAVTSAGVKIVKGIATKRYVRLSLAAGGTTPSITYSAKLNPLV